MGRITIDEISQDLKAYIEGLGLSEEEVNQLIENVTGDMSSLQTENKTVAGAINELFQNANNGKELIATAIGEPLSSEDTFSAMSTEINGLLSTFKTNMMNNGVSVESSDKFKTLIEKLALLADSEGKGIQYAEGTYTVSSTNSEVRTTYTVELDFGFTPNYVFAEFCYNNYQYNDNGGVNIVSNIKPYDIVTNSSINGTVTMSDVSQNGFTITSSTGNYACLKGGTFNWYAIGVGEEDTTLLDSLKSILIDEGVNVTEEDTIADLVVKTDNEFNNKNTKAENTRSKLAGLMKDGGYDITGNEDIDTLLGLLTASGIKLDEIKQIACGDSHTVILKTDGSLWACGLNSSGQLGLGHNTDYSIFTQVTTNINNDVKQIACNNNYTFILKNDGSVWACGFNYYGQLGLGDTEDRNTFTQVTTNIDNDVQQVICGYNHTFIIKNDGTVWACGKNNKGQLGLGTSDYGANTTFTKVTTNINNDVKQIACGYEHTFILKNDGSVYSCGYNINGQLGVGDYTEREIFFTQIPKGLSY